MSTRIRLNRIGRKKVPYYKVVVIDSRQPKNGKIIEKLGTFDPLLDHDNEKRVILNKERAEYWLSVGAIPSDRVALMMVALGVKGAEKYKPVFIPKEKKKEEVKEEKVETPAVEEKVETPAVEEKVEETPAEETTTK